jgi:hypothetical protein
MSTRKTTVEEAGLQYSDDAPSVKIAVMNNDIRHINETLGRLEGKFDVAVQSFATNQQLIDAASTSDNRHKEYDTVIASLQSDVRTLRDKDNEQQGSINATRRIINVALIAITAFATVIGATWWIPSLLHK